MCFILLLMNNPLVAQNYVRVSTPVWGSTVTTQEYYYLPDIESYYDISKSEFIFFNNGNWTRSKNLPKQFKNYNLKKGKVIVIHDYHGDSPYAYFKNHKKKYNTKKQPRENKFEHKESQGKGKSKQNKKEK